MSVNGVVSDGWLELEELLINDVWVEKFCVVWELLLDNWEALLLDCKLLLLLALIVDVAEDIFDAYLETVVVVVIIVVVEVTWLGSTTTQKPLVPLTCPT